MASQSSCVSLNVWASLSTARGSITRAGGCITAWASSCTAARAEGSHRGLGDGPVYGGLAHGSTPASASRHMWNSGTDREPSAWARALRLSTAATTKAAGEAKLPREVRSTSRSVWYLSPSARRSNRMSTATLGVTLGP